MLDQVPQEIFRQVLLALERPDLKALRLVSTAFARNVAPVLFRKIDVSLLTLSRLRHISHHPQLSKVVEELHYHEMCFESGANHKDRRIAELCSYITEFAVRSNRYREFNVHLPHYILFAPELSEFLTNDWGVPAPGSAEDEEAATEFPDPEPDKVKSMLEVVLRSYAENSVLQKTQHLYPSFGAAFKLLENLQRIICIEADTGGIAVNVSCP